MSDIVINSDVLFALIGIGMAIGGAVITFALKNTADISEMKGCIKRIEEKQNHHEEESKYESDRLREVEKDVARLERR